MNPKQNDMSGLGNQRTVASGTVYAIVSNFLEHRQNKSGEKKTGFYVRVMVSDTDFPRIAKHTSCAHVIDPG